MCNGGHRYCISCLPGEMPNWLSYSEEGCSLSFYIPPVFQGLVVWFVCPPLEKEDYYCFNTDIIIIIRNKSNGTQLFEDKRVPAPGGWIRYISRSEMAMEDYCGGDELELHIYSEPTEYALRMGYYWKPIVKECGVHVIAGKSDSFGESAVGRDTLMPSPPLYHLLPHPHHGSMTASTPKQWIDFLFAKLQGHNLNLTLYGKNTYFL